MKVLNQILSKNTNNSAKIIVEAEHPSQKEITLP